MPRSPISRLAAPCAIAAGILMIVAQAVMLPFDPDDHQETSQDPVFQVAGVGYLVAFCLLLLTLIAAYALQDREVGRFGVVAVVVAVVGTLLLAGDLWFETFAVPWLADGSAPEVLDDDPSTLLALGAISSYVLFALGWVLFGIASFRAHVFPVAICVAIVIGGALGFSALVSPFGIPLGLAVTWLGLWMVRSARTTAPAAGVATA
jgi:hypothetical protein